MKQSLIALASLGMGASAFAGTSESMGYAPGPSVAPAGPSLWSWFAGGSVGYLVDSEEALYSVHLGSKIAESGPASHSLFVEYGYTKDSDAFSEVETMPLTLNYKFDYQLNDRWSFYAGAGAGVSFIDARVLGFSDESAEFTAQAFAGLGFDVTKNFQLYGGARYLWIDDTTLFGRSVEPGDDVSLEVGGRIRF
jgi:opacity protein-like surface antigen